MTLAIFIHMLPFNQKNVKIVDIFVHEYQNSTFMWLNVNV